MWLVVDDGRRRWRPASRARRARRRSGAASTLTSQAVAGEKVYADHCAKCHGQDLAGIERAPALAGLDLRSTMARRHAHETVRTRRGDAARGTQEPHREAVRRHPGVSAEGERLSRRADAARARPARARRRERPRQARTSLRRRSSGRPTAATSPACGTRRSTRSTRTTSRSCGSPGGSARIRSGRGRTCSTRRRR